MSNQAAGATTERDRLAPRRAFAVPPPHARQHAVRMSDGILLATDVYLPESGSGAVLLSRLPYDKAGDECFMPAIADWLTHRGYVVVVQDVRGKLRSGGDVSPFVTEVEDGFDTLEWITDQSWCTGPIGMFGDSYYGFTQWAAVASGHPALRAIAPRVTTADFRSTFQRQGVFPLESKIRWALETLVDEALYDVEDALDWTVRPLSDLPVRTLDGRMPLGLGDWAQGRGIPASSRVPVDGTVPALHLGGFADLLLRGQLATWRAARKGPAPQPLILDARDHGWNLGTPGPTTQESSPRASSDTMRRYLDDYLGPLLPFFDHYLRDAGSKDTPAVRWRTNDGRWHESPSWPPPASQLVTMRLTSEGCLQPDAVDDAGTRSWQHDPRRPVPSLIHPYNPFANRMDEREVWTRPDVLTFTSAPMSAPVTLVGPAHVRTRLTASAGSAHLMATLYDLGPDDTVARIADGALLARAPWPQPVEVDMGDLGYTLATGHRLGLSVAGSSYPRYILHPGNDTDPWTTTDVDTATLSITTGCEHDQLTLMTWQESDA